jgi:signal transduction histidine kinase
VLGLREISLSITASTFFALGMYVLIANPKRDPNRAFGLFCIFASLWVFGALMIRLSGTREEAVFWGKVPFVAGALAIGFFLYFSTVFPEEAVTKKFPITKLLLIPGLAFAIISLTDLVLKDVVLESWGYNPVYGVAHRPFMLYLFSYIVLGIILLFYKYRRPSSSIRKAQLKYVLLGLTVSGTITLITNGLMPAMGSSYFADLGPTSCVILVVSTSYAIVRHRLMDIGFVLTRGTSILLAGFIVYIPAVMLTAGAGRFLFGITHIEFTLFAISSGTVAALIFYRARWLTEPRIRNLFLKDQADYRVSLLKFGSSIIRILDINDLGRKVVDTFFETMSITSTSLFILDEKRSLFQLHDYKRSDADGEIVPTISRDDDLVTWLLEGQTILVKEELTLRQDLGHFDSIVKKMDEMDADVCIPLISRKRIIGLLNLGKKRNGKPYSLEDSELLSGLANQASIAIENALLYENYRLQQALLGRADRLAALGTLAAGLAHEIRNPLVAVKTLTQLLPERMDDEEFRKEFTQIASQEIDRMASLVNELLEFARPSEPQLQPENLKEVMQGMILLISTHAMKKDLEIETQIDDDLPLVNIDREQMKQVLLNLLLNAIDATPEGGRIKLEVHALVNERGQRALHIEVSDTGCGIPEENVEQIFTPFFSTKGKGSGLGLSISNQIVQDHHGTITVRSRLDEGTSFLIMLPAYDENHEENSAESVKQPESPQELWL